MNDTVDSVVPVTHLQSALWSKAFHAWEAEGHWAACEVLAAAERKHEAEVERLREVLRKVQSEALHGEVTGLRDGADNWRSSLRLIEHVARLALEASQ